VLVFGIIIKITFLQFFIVYVQKIPPSNVICMYTYFLGVIGVVGVVGMVGVIGIVGVVGMVGVVEVVGVVGMVGMVGVVGVVGMVGLIGVVGMVGMVGVVEVVGMVGVVEMVEVNISSCLFTDDHVPYQHHGEPSYHIYIYIHNNKTRIIIPVSIYTFY
jgi:hypothetical protein